MKMPWRCWACLLIVAAGTVTCLAGAVAAEPAEPPGPEADAGLREQTVYIPYKRLRAVFEKEGRGVFLPYAKFMDLWRRARERSGQAEERPPPAPYLVTRVGAVATVKEEVVEVAAELRIEVLTAGWQQIPLRLSQSAITAATIDGRPARLIGGADHGYKLLVENSDDKPLSLTLQLSFAKAFAKATGRNSVRFDAPLAPVSKWDVRIPQSGVEVNVQPLLAATAMPGRKGKEETRVLAFVGASPTVRIEWVPRAEGAKGLKALADVQARQQVSVEAGVVRTRTQLQYRISRAELSRLTVAVPVGQRVVNVFDPNVREWSVRTVGDMQQISVSLFEAAKQTQSLLLELERFGVEGETEATVPVVRALGVGRQQGMVLVKVADGLRAEALKHDGLLQLDAAELPRDVVAERWDFSYRYAALPFALTLRVEKIRPRIAVDALMEAHLSPEELLVDYLCVQDIQRAGVFRLAFDVPASYTVREVTGVAVGGSAAAEVDSFHVTDGILDVSLTRKAAGRVGLAVALRRRLEEADLLAPTGQSAQVALPLLRARAVQREAGRVVVYAPESLRVNPAEMSGLRPISFAEAWDRMRHMQKAGERPRLAFAYGSQPAKLSVSGERRRPQVTARQLLSARFEFGVVTYRASLFYDILYSSVKAVRLDVPAALATDIRIVTTGIRRVVLDGAERPDGTADDAVAWALAGGTELIGSVRIDLSWEGKIDKLDVGKPVAVTVPVLLPRAVDRAWGQVVLEKAESIDVAPVGAPVGLRPIDPRHDLMPGVAVHGAARAYEFHDAWQLNVTATRYEMQDVKATSIERGLVRMVMTRSDVTSVQAVYRLRSVRQRLVIRLPEDVAFDTRPLRLNGRPAPLEKGAEGEYFVPLAGQTPDRPFVLELRYTVAGAGGVMIVPEFPREPATQWIYLSVYLPRERAFLGASGPWHPEVTWMLRGFSAWSRGNRNADWLIRWVSEGVNIDQAALKTFATDGRHLLFSTLRPPSGDAGALHLFAMRAWLLEAIILLLGIGLGVWLLPASGARRAVVVGACVTALVLCAVFAPSLAHASIGNATVGGAFLVFLLWGLWYLLVTRPRDPAVQARRAVRAAASATDDDSAFDRLVESAPRMAGANGDVAAAAVGPAGDAAASGEMDEAPAAAPSAKPPAQTPDGDQGGPSDA